MNMVYSIVTAVLRMQIMCSRVKTMLRVLFTNKKTFAIAQQHAHSLNACLVYGINKGVMNTKYQLKHYSLVQT